VAGAGLPGAAEVASAEWVEVRDLQNQEGLRTAQEKHPLGVGRTQVDRLLDPKNDITLSSLQRAAAMVGRRIVINLV
jgi:antitoxin HicB